ncbi:MAG TPA: response regulator [Terriglobales bacterium]|jgi:PAS domain S-box-containing protein
MENVRSAPTVRTRLNVLLVGSNQENYKHLYNVLSRPIDSQFKLDHASTLEEAVPLLQRMRHDLLLCDYEAGGHTALHIVHELRKTAPQLPVIFLSDYVNRASLQEALEESIQNKKDKENISSQKIIARVNGYFNERQLQKAEDMLRKLGRAVEQSADVVIITDRAGIIEYVNPAFETVTGYTQSEVLGLTPRILKSGQHPAEFYQQMWQTILAGQVFQGVLVNRKKNGETFIVEKTITPLRDGDGQVTHLISNDRDITDRRRLESQLQMAHKMDAIGRLAGGVAHDFNNLLMVISAYAELMQDSLASGHPLLRNVHEIMRASKRAADLTRQLLAFGRKQMQALQLLDLNHVLKEIGKMLPRLIGEDIHLTIVQGRNIGCVKADPLQIEQIVMNLAANARDAMPAGGKLTIETAGINLDEDYVQKHSIVPIGDYVLLAVTDTGQGIAPEHLSHIFEPFYTTKAEGKGTGLGLATVYGIVKQNGGFIWVYSEPGLGTTFKIYLPRVKKEAGASKPTDKPVQEAPRGVETILLVEDENAVRQSTGQFLRLNGYTIVEAKDGEDALRVARSYSGTIDMMITDVVMPHLGGAKLAAQLASTRPAMKVLFVSGYAETTVLRHGAIDVTNSFLQKPFGLKSLAVKIRQVLDTNVSAATVTN